MSLRRLAAPALFAGLLASTPVAALAQQQGMNTIVLTPTILSSSPDASGAGRVALTPTSDADRMFVIDTAFGFRYLPPNSEFALIVPSREPGMRVLCSFTTDGAGSGTCQGQTITARALPPIQLRRSGETGTAILQWPSQGTSTGF